MLENDAFVPYEQLFRGGAARQLADRCVQVGDTDTDVPNPAMQAMLLDLRLIPELLCAGPC